jgi:branched-chain amino acid transport system ATP-binding protein
MNFRQEAPTSEILAARNLCTRYGRVPILMGVDFAMREGEFIGILGHNGMDKTTLMRTLMGALPATEGSVSFEGRDVTKFSVHARARAGLGLVPQGREIFPTLSVWENLRMGFAAAPREDARVIENVLEEFPRLKWLLDRRGGVLSGGEQQLLVLARCLFARPKLVLLDEPTEGIQPSVIEEIVETLLRLKQRWALSMIIVEQNLEFITSLSDRILQIQKGRITGEVSSDDLMSGHFGMTAA